MKTPMQELIEQIKQLKYSEINEQAWDAYDSVMDIAESMLEKEKEVMCEFAWEYERECRINLERSIEKCWYETFKTEEK